MGNISDELLDKYLKTDFITEQVTVRVMAEHSEEKGDFGTNLILPVELDDKTYKLRLNKTNRLKLVDKFGSKNTSDWIGKEFLLSTAPTIVSGKERKLFMVE